MAAVNVPIFAHLINGFAPEHNDFNIIHKNLRDLGLFLVFSGASIVLGAIPEHSDNSKNIFMAFAIFVMGMLLVWLSLVVNLFPRTAASVNAVLEPTIFIIAMWFIGFWIETFRFESVTRGCLGIRIHISDCVRSTSGWIISNSNRTVSI